MPVIERHDRRGAVFLLFTAVVYLGNLAIAPTYRDMAALPVPEWVIGFDLLLLVPAAYLLLKRPPLKQALVGVFALASLGVLVGSFAIPRQDKHVWLFLENVRWLYLAGLILAQLALIVSVIRDIRRNWSAPDIESAVSQAIAARVPDATVSALLQADARVWLYALVRNPCRHAPSVPAFHASRHDSNASNQQGFLILIAVEIPVLHVLIHFFSPVAALWVTGLSLYGLLFLYSEYRATLLRATTLESGWLHIRHGVLGDLQVPYDCIESVEPVNFRPKRGKSVLRFVGTGTANLRINLRPDTRLATLLGAKSVQAIYIGLDEPHAFRDALYARLDA